jgi:hypothetical protein
MEEREEGEGEGRKETPFQSMAEMPTTRLGSARLPSLPRSLSRGFLGKSQHFSPPLRVVSVSVSLCPLLVFVYPPSPHSYLLPYRSLLPSILLLMILLHSCIFACSYTHLPTYNKNKNNKPSKLACFYKENA